MTASPVPEANEAAEVAMSVVRLAELVCAALHPDEQADIACSPSDPDPRYQAATHFVCFAAAQRLAKSQDLRSVLLAAGWLPPEARARELREAVEAVLSDLWIPSPVAPESIAQNELLHEIRAVLLARADSLAPEAPSERPYCLRCEIPIYQDDEGVWRREATGSQVCPRNPAVDGHEPRLAPSEATDAGTFFRDASTGEPCPRVGNVLCAMPYDPEHRHVHRPRDERGYR